MPSVQFIWWLDLKCNVGNLFACAMCMYLSPRLTGPSSQQHHGQWCPIAHSQCVPVDAHIFRRHWNFGIVRKIRRVCIMLNICMHACIKRIFTVRSVQPRATPKFHSTRWSTSTCTRIWTYTWIRHTHSVFIYSWYNPNTWVESV